MRTFLLLLATSIGAAACGDPAGPASETGPTPDARTVQIYAAVIRDVVEFPEAPVQVWTRVCVEAEGAIDGTHCPDSLSADEQEAIRSVLADQVPDLRFVDETAAVTRGILDGDGGELVRVGPIDEIEGRVQVPASHVCGGLCGGGSVWVLEEGDHGWAVTGPAPGHGVWIS